MALVARRRLLFVIGEVDAGVQDAAAYITRGIYLQLVAGSYNTVSATSQFLLNSRMARCLRCARPTRFLCHEYGLDAANVQCRSIIDCASASPSAHVLRAQVPNMQVHSYARRIR